jgi:hypothetical protein
VIAVLITRFFPANVARFLGIKTFVGTAYAFQKRCWNNRTRTNRFGTKASVFHALGGNPGLKEEEVINAE